MRGRCCRDRKGSVNSKIPLLHPLQLGRVRGSGREVSESSKELIGEKSERNEERGRVKCLKTRLVLAKSCGSEREKQG